MQLPLESQRAKLTISERLEPVELAAKGSAEGKESPRRFTRASAGVRIKEPFAAAMITGASSKASSP